MAVNIHSVIIYQEERGRRWTSKTRKFAEDGRATSILFILKLLWAGVHKNLERQGLRKKETFSLEC